MQPFVFLQRQNRFDISWQHRWGFWVCCCAFPLRQWVILQECSYLWSGTSPASPPSSWRSGWFGRVCVTPDCRGHFGHRSCWGHGYWKLIGSNHYLGESVGEKPNGQEHTETQPFIRKHPSLMTDFSFGRCSLSPLPPWVPRHLLLSALRTAQWEHITEMICVAVSSAFLFPLICLFQFPVGFIILRDNRLSRIFLSFTYLLGNHRVGPLPAPEGSPCFAKKRAWYPTWRVEWMAEGWDAISTSKLCCQKKLLLD